MYLNQSLYCFPWYLENATYIRILALLLRTIIYSNNLTMKAYCI